ncbi:splicing factor, proline- and glutamine-rich [Drosophila eugracilis]|uniref:splicing factor, proline- and glutamine-rich n=1 Tax=Drosophila eugracilis TaxID=29029 RepID=UPI0007E7D4DE|nr:splicing factor, proline- and glutamine-rich [Drosophila eugracilis]
MSSPCGKCVDCPCGTSGGGQPPQQPPHRPPPSYDQQPQHQQPDSCPYTPPRAQGACGCPAPSQAPRQAPAAGGCQVTSYQPQGDPASCNVNRGPQNRGPQTVECTCTHNRVRGQQTIQADHITCSRGPREQPPVMETRCTCREQPAKVECYCAPPVGPQGAPTQQQPPTHANVTCGQSMPRGPKPYHHKGQGQNPCGHCRSQKKQKKCVIQ